MRNVLRRFVESDLFFRLTEIIDRRSENRVSELGMLAQAFQFAKINEVRGDYFEFGL